MNSDDILRRPLTSELGGILPRKWQPANEVNPRFKMVPWEYCFLLGTGGIQSVLFPWLIAVYLQESPTRVGIAQMAGLLPMLFLFLFGGWLGDRVDQRRLSVVLASMLAVPPLIIAGFFYVDMVAYELLLCRVVLTGCFGAFAQPARDAMLNRVAGENV